MATLKSRFPTIKPILKRNSSSSSDARPRMFRPNRRTISCFGYTIGLDVSDRDLQKSEKQFSRCKSFDTYTPIGPFVYSDVDVRDLALELRQNGEIRQRARTSQMIYPLARNCFVRQPIAHSVAGRRDFDRNALGRWADSRRGRAGGTDRRLAAVADPRVNAR